MIGLREIGDECGVTKNSISNPVVDWSGRWGGRETKVPRCARNDKRAGEGAKKAAPGWGGWVVENKGDEVKV
jgi:hypothetical protein